MMRKPGLLLLFLLAGAYGMAQQLPSLKIEEVVAYYKKPNDSVYVINFWATFCKPCVAEIPYLQTIARKYATKKVNLLLVSLDLPAFYPGTIQKFADKNQFTAQKAWLNESDADYFCSKIDSTWSGAIPATLFVNAATGYKYFTEGEMTASEFEAALTKAIEGGN